MDVMEPKVPKRKSNLPNIRIPAGEPILNQQRAKLLDTHICGIAGESAWITRGFHLEELQLAFSYLSLLLL